MNDDFYHTVNQQWLNSTNIPDSHSRYSQFDIVTKSNQKKIISLLQSLNDNILKPFYQKAIDIPNSTDSIQSIHQYVSSIKDNLLAQSTIDGFPSLINIDIMPDLKNDQLETVYLNEPILSLPNKQYYLKPKYQSYYQAFTTYLKNTIQKYQLNINPDNVLHVENQLAKHSLDKHIKRNVDNIYNVYTLEQVSQMYDIQPIIQQFKNISSIQYPEKVIVTNPKLIKNLNTIATQQQYHDYIIWIIYNNSLPFINHDTELHHFQFYGKTLNGLKEMKPIEYRTISVINSLMGDLLGYHYGEKYFTNHISERIHTMIDNIKETMRIKIKNLSWMSNDTKSQALDKLEKMKYKIGMPIQIKDYSKLKLSGTFWEMMRQISRYLIIIQMETIGKKSDPNLWEIGAHEVNAYYSLVKNEIVFPSGILQPPFFDAEADDEVIYGAIGTIIGHEISHAFDDQGKKFDKDGKLHDWWEAQDKVKYDAEAKKMIQQFDSLQENGHKLNGKLTLGENLADLGGVLIALHTIKRIKPRPNLDKFFQSYAMLWRQLIRKEEIARRIESDPHSLAKYRVNQILGNVPDFIRYYDIKPDDKMHIKESLRVNLWT